MPMKDFFDHPNPSPSNRLWLFAVIAVGMGVLAYTAGWLYLAATARGGAEVWVEARRAEGMTVRYDSMEETGYPLAVRLDIVNPGVGAPNSASPWGWEGERLEISVKLWDWEDVSLKTSGRQMLALTPPAGGMATFNGDAGDVSVSVDLRRGDLGIAIHDLALTGDTPALGGFAIAQGTLRVTRPDPDGARLDMHLRDLRLPGFVASPLGDGVREVTLSSRLLGDLPTGPVTDSLTAWRDGGGTIEIDRLAVRHGPMAVKADGTLALDGALQPIGAFTARVEGFFDTIDALQKIGMVKARDAVTAKMILGVMSRRPENGGPATLNLALTLQDRRLFAGPVSLLKFSQVDWKQFGRIN